jgi:transcriptional regulator with XRE-family HTH domain
MINDEERIRTAYNFRRLRKAKGWTIKQAAEKGGVSFGYIGHLERGETGLGAKKQKWADIFSVDIAEFLLPVDETQIEKELAALKSEAGKYSVKKIQRLRKMLPMLLEEGSP